MSNAARAVLLALVCLTVGLPLGAEAYVISQMEADHARPYIYALDRGTGSTGESLLFINTDTEEIEKVLSIGPNPTDMSIHYGEGLLYITNWGSSQTRVVDLNTQTETTPLSLGNDVYKINAGRPGRIYYEQEDQWIDMPIIDTATGAQVGRMYAREGDAEISPDGTAYYHCDNNRPILAVESDGPLITWEPVNPPFRPQILPRQNISVRLT